MRLGLNLSVSMGQLVLSLGRKFYNLLAGEEAASNTNVFYDPADLTSLRVNTDGSGGNPVVGDPVGIMLDTSQFGGKTAEDYLAGATELVTNGTFDTDVSGWTGVNATLASVSGQLKVTDAGGYASARQVITTKIGVTYQVTLDIIATTNINVDIYNGENYLAVAPDIGLGQFTSAGTAQSTVFIAEATSSTISIRGNFNNGAVYTFDNISIKEIPGHHAIAPSDSARPVLFDDPDLTAAALTDNGRGEELVTNGTFDSDTTGWTVRAGCTISSESGRFRLTFTGTSAGRAYTTITGLEIGAEYEVKATGYNVSGASPKLIVQSSNGATAIDSVLFSLSDGVEETSTFRARETSHRIEVGNDGGNSVDAFMEVDEVTVRKVLTAFDERGAELVSQGDGTEVSDWSTGNNAVISSVGGKIRVENGAASFGYAYLSLTLEVGKTYEFKADMFHGNDDALVRIGSNATGAQNKVYDSGLIASQASVTTTFTAVTSTTYIRISPRNNTIGQYAEFDNISVRRVLYPNLVTNGTFDTDSDWTKGTGWSIGSGVATIAAGTSGVNFFAFALNNSEINKWYKLTYYVPRINGGQVRPYLDAVGYLGVVSSTGWHTAYFRRSHSIAFKFVNSSSSDDYDIDNVSIQELPASIDRKYYLDTDGSDDWMEVKPTLNLGEQWWHVGAWQSDVGGNAHTRAFSTSDDYRGAPIISPTGNWGWWNAAGNGITDLTTEDVTNKQVLTIEQAGTNSISGRSNGANSAGAITPYDDSGSTQGLALFSQQNTSFSAGLDGRFYGGSWGQGQVDYDELTVLQDYLGTTTQPPIDPPDVTEYADVYELLAAQTGAVLFDIEDTTSLRVGRDGSGGVPVDGDPVGMMLDVSDTGGATVAAATAARPELVTNGTFDSDTSGWTPNNLGLLSVDTQRLKVETGNSGSWNYGYQQISVVLGRAYRFRASSFEGTAAKHRILLGTQIANGDIVMAGGPLGSSGDKEVDVVFTATTSSVFIALQNNDGVLGSHTFFDNISVKEISSHAAIAPSDSARPNLATENSPISSREVLTTTFGWNITDGGRA